MLVLLDYSYPDYEIMSQLSKLACVTEVNRVDGPYDIIVKLSDNNMDTIKESIGKHMTRIQGIQSTLTLMSVWLIIGWSLIVDCVNIDVHSAIDINSVCSRWLILPWQWTTYTSVSHPTEPANYTGSYTYEYRVTSVIFSTGLLIQIKLLYYRKLVK